MPVQVPDAEQDVELVEDQVKVTTVSINTDEDDEERDEVGLGSGAGALLPPPPPPQPAINKNTSKLEKVKFLVKLKTFSKKYINLI